MELNIKPNSKPQALFFASSEYEVLYGGSSGGGKMLDLDTPIPTPTGWIRNGDIVDGDIILSEKGKPIRVKKAHPIVNSPESYKLVFDDGSELKADANHLWLTFTGVERVKSFHRTEEFRARRRANRPRRIGGLKSETFTQAITLRNQNRQYEYKSVPLGSIRTTKEISETLISKKGEHNHSIPVTYPIELPPKKFFIPPYVLGAWLGDGSKSSGGFTSIDSHITDKIESYGFRISHQPNVQSHYISGLVTLLKKYDLINNKHIPPKYLRGSIQQRMELLQGLMDTDGTVCDSGSVEFTNTNKKIIDGIFELIISFGWKARIISGLASLNGRITGPKYDIKWTPDQIVFSLPRKAEKQRLATRQTTKCRYIISCTRIESIPMRCITVDNPTGLYLAGMSMIPTHNTQGLIIDPLRYISYSDFSAIIFRENYPQLERAVIPEAKRIYTAAGARWNDTKKRFQFPSGAYIDLGYLDTPESWVNYQGAPYVGQYFDELTTLYWDNFEQLAVWNRAAGSGGIRPYRRATSNPGGLSHTQVKNYFIDTCPAEKDGPPKFSQAAQMTWQPMKPGKAYVYVAENGQRLTRKYIPARVYDNEDLLRNNPFYLAQLLKLPAERRKAFLEGDWDMFEGQFFSSFRRNFHVINNYAFNPAFNTLAGLDYGNVSALELVQRDVEGTVIAFDECYMPDLETPTDRANAIADFLLERKYYKLRIMYDTDMESSQISNVGFDKTPVEIFRQVFRQRMTEEQRPLMLPVSKKSLDKDKRYRHALNEAIKDYLRIYDGIDGSKKTKLYISSQCPFLIRSFTELLHDTKNPTGMDYDNTHPMRHQFDGFKYGFQELYSTKETKEEDLRLIPRPTARQSNNRLNDPSLRF